uniref:Alpha-catenin n=1 Tax=Caenorhabditis japonica TaxID=281687 RepID=A0A8R1DYI7_CAEJA
MNTSTNGTSQPFFNIDEVRSKNVLKQITQLINEVTNITETFPLAQGQSTEGLVLAIDASLANFLSTGNHAIERCPIARTDPVAIDALAQALRAVQDTGQVMIQTGRDFVRDSTSTPKRAHATTSGRNLLIAVAKFLILADSIDVRVIVDRVDELRETIHQMSEADSKIEVDELYKMLLSQIEELDITVRRRAIDLVKPNQRDDLLAARAALRQTAPLLYNSTRTFVRHPEREEASRNRDFTVHEMHAALDTLENALNGHTTQYSFSDYGRIGDLINEIDTFQNRIEMEPSTYRRDIHRPELEERAERIVSGSASIADAGNTRENRKQKIVAECNNLRQALQELLTEYEKSRGRYDESDDIPLGIAEVHKKTKDLRRHLRRAIVDHISDAFLDTRTPIILLIEAAKTGSEEKTAYHAQVFQQHANDIVHVARLSCRLSSDVEGISVIQLTAAQLERLAPQVSEAAFLLCAQNESKAAQENMEAYKNLWFSKVSLLTTALDNITTLDDFLAVSEAHIVEDCERAIKGITAPASTAEENSTNCASVDFAAGSIRGRALRVCDVVDSEMDFIQNSEYTETVKQAVKILRNKKVDEFAERASNLANRHEKSGLSWDANRKEEEMNEFINACTLVHDAVKDIRHALLMNRSMNDVDSDVEYEADGVGASDVDANRTISDQDQQTLMRRLPEEEKKKIQAQIEIFKVTQTRFEREVAKWDETGNDIIQLANNMCKIMMNMTDFTRGCGPLKTTMDVIRAAQEISLNGSKLNALARQIGEESADSQTKKDLLAYLSQITLYCQQLNICSKVKADVTQIGNELVVSALDSAMSLIQTARNLLTAVVHTVKAAYIASTKCALRERARVETAVALGATHDAINYESPSDDSGKKDVVVNLKFLITRAEEFADGLPNDGLFSRQKCWPNLRVTISTATVATMSIMRS